MAFSKYALERLRLIQEKPHIYHVGGPPGQPATRVNLLAHQKPKPVLGTNFGPTKYQLLPKEVLYEARRPEIRRHSGVYFLWRARELIYVGSSKNVHTRMQSHSVTFDHCSFLLINFPWYLSVEAAYIVGYRPVENSMHLRQDP